MTTQPTLGAQQSAGSLHRAGTQAQFLTWSSIDQELAPSARPPQALKAPRSLRVELRKKAHALFQSARSAFKASKLRETLLDILLIGGAAALICSVAASIPVSLYLLFVAKF